MPRTGVKPSILGMAGVLACLLMAVFTMGSAQAAVPANHGAADHVLTAPAAPWSSASASALVAAATSPTVSPSASYIHVAPGGSFTCASGDLCTAVWDAATSNWKIFFLYQCNKYSLSSWNGTGYFWDHQTGGVPSHFYNQDGSIARSFTPDGGVTHSQDWGPIWSIRNC